MRERVNRICHVCGSNVGFTKDDNDCLLYCGCCNSLADDFFDTAIDDEEFFRSYSASCNRVRPAIAIDTEPISEVKLSTSQFLDHPNIEDAMDDGVGPTQPSNFASSQKRYSYKDSCIGIRSSYVMGIQFMIRMQSQALVEKFNVSPLIIGIVGPLWLRLLASTKIMAVECADLAFRDSEARKQAYVWCRYLRSGLPISSSLAISLLVCHVAREPILPTDMLKWALEGKLPYFAAFVEIEKQLGSCSKALPISVSRMLRPIQPISSQKLEAMAADIAQRIGLKLPPVNFYAIASRYLRQLSLPTGKLLYSACRIYEWSTPSELYLSANEFRSPTRAYAMSVLIVAIRTLFDINGYGTWESSFSSASCSSSRVKNEDNESESRSFKTENLDDDSYSNNAEALIPRMSVLRLLKIFDAKYCELSDTHEYSHDLPTYLQYCKDVVFCGLNPSFEDVEEKELIEELWKFYENNKGARTSDEKERSGDDCRSRKDEVRQTGDQSTCSTGQNNCSHRNQDSACSSRTPKESTKEKAMRQLKLDMEENHFCYIPPRVQVKRRDYLHYARKRKGMLIYAVHADYYILLRCCAKIASVETRIMHNAVLSLERRLQWLEKRVDRSLLLHSNLDDVCEFYEGDAQNDRNIPIDLNI